MASLNTPYMHRVFDRVLILLGTLLCIPSASSLLAQTNADCLSCHSDQSLTTERNGKEISLFVNEAVLKKSPHARLACVACHTGFDKDNLPHKENITPINCMTCHADAPPKHRFHPQMIRAGGKNGTPDISCKTCHGRHDIVSPKVPGSKFHSGSLVQTCGACHAAMKETFLHSVHARAAAEGAKGAPDCLSCHRNDITKARPGRDLAQLKIAQEKTCLSCHLDDPDIRARTAPSAGFIAAYEKSVHGSALLKGNEKAANCVNCHGSHEVQKGNDPSARVNKAHIPEICGSCHSAILADFKESIHGQAAVKGNNEAPVCTSCHGEHNILSPSDPRSPVAPLNVSGQVCSPCHSSVALTQKYGLESDRFKTFSDSYHGLAIRSGSVEVANCASCHGAHTIKPSSDLTSRVNKANLASTCGSCHPGANERFAVGRVHVAISQAKEPALYWIETFYVILIVSVVGGMFIHNGADFYRKARRKLLIRRGVIHEDHVGHSLYLRMTLSERLQHASLLISFTVLVITGFMLRYPDAWWVLGLRGVSDSFFDMRGLLHRSAAVLLIVGSLYHFYYILFTPRGKQLIKDLLPGIGDLKDALAVLKYNFGFSKQKPRFGRFSYIEKSEYWALVWGNMVMGVTGVFMWFDNTFMGLLTKLGWDIARTVHFYEAWLATLAIIVWHIYYVIFNPDTYPMNLAWLTGKITESEMSEEHPLELEQLKKKGTEMMEVSAADDTSERKSARSSSKPSKK